MAVPSKILIVGGGVFGLSTALSLTKRHPTSQVTLLEASPTIPNPHGSSVDTSRIVRADYSNPIYAKLAVEAIERWRNTEWGHEDRYIQNGLLLVYPDGDSSGKDYAIKSYHNVKKLEGKNVELLPSEKDVLRVAPAFGPNLGVSGGYINWGSGWSNAEEGVRYAKKKLDEEGKVRFQTGEVQRLLFGDAADKRRVTGVVLADGNTVSADLVILATGAWTAKLIDLRGRAVATGQALAYMRITDEEQARLAHMPTILNFSTGMFILPPRNNLLKIACHAYGYINTKPAAVPGADGQTANISLPDVDVPIPVAAENEFRMALKQLVPALADRPFCKTRVCWYTDTPKGDFIVTHHPEYSGLFVATGGSGHAYKFLPVLGDKVVDALEGMLDKELRDSWAWPDAVDEATFFGTEDGSRAGPKGLHLTEELAKDRKAKRTSSL
ncbi:FAD dependent oxidoreductase [Aspergillus floccosus]